VNKPFFLHPFQQLRSSLGEVMLCDRRKFQRELDKLHAQHTPDSATLAALAFKIEQAKLRHQQRQAQRPAITLDSVLPITQKAEQIVELIQKNQVLILAGETGSGKTTQLPKLCLQAGRGISGLIGCTQPRRIAARSMARRVAQELGNDAAGWVGYQVRFSDQVSDNAYIKFMTDGILLAETQHDPWLNAYDTLILDEAHERSLNIDFLLGYLKRLLLKRRDLKVIVTSATIDTARFAEHFSKAPVIEIEGRGFPVEVRYRPAEEITDGGPIEAIVQAVDEITQEDRLGDILIFLAGEKEIRDAHRALEQRRYKETEVLPLYARLSASDQDRVFKPGPKRRIVLATNVAETSLTVPRIRYVIDPGTARIKRYNQRSQLDRLHVEPISQAAADQRKGRCGRIASGICVRLYSESDFQSRARFSDPEILRSSLAGVILRMLSLKLGDVENFPFVEMPPQRAIGDGYRKLEELGALDEQRQLTSIGRTLAKFPIDVALARMLVEAQRLQALRELLILTAFLSIQDPRERPADFRPQADAAHAVLADNKSDFFSILNLWKAYSLAHEELTQSKLRDWCRERFLSYLRMREWRELHRQLLLITQELSWTQNVEQANFEKVHRCLLSGWPTQVARRDEKGQYLGTRQRKYQIFPGSSLIKHPPAWLLSGQILDTQRIYALLNAKIEPAWIEQQAVHLLKRHWRDPYWSRKQGAVMAFEQISLFGLVLVERRPVMFGKQNPELAREIFIREALVTGEIDCRADFVRANARVIAQAHELEAQQRRQGLLRSEVELCEFFSDRLPENIYTSSALDKWWKQASPYTQATMFWSLQDVLSSGTTLNDVAFPACLEMANTQLRIEYRFIPGDPADGITLEIPLSLLNAIDSQRLEWLVPGMAEEKIAALIRALPKNLRRNFVPAPEFARAFCEFTTYGKGDLLSHLAAFLQRRTGIVITRESWEGTEVDPHLRMNLRLMDEQGNVLSENRDLMSLRQTYAQQARQAFSRHSLTEIPQREMSEFRMEEIPEMVLSKNGLRTFPALVDLGNSVALEIFETQQEAEAAHTQGIIRLLRNALADRIKQAQKQLPLNPSLGLKYAGLGSVEALRSSLVEAAFRQYCQQNDLNIRRREGFEALKTDAEKKLFTLAMERLKLVEAIISAHAELSVWLKPTSAGFAEASYTDLQEQFDHLFFSGFMGEVENSRLLHYPRYLHAMRLRAERLRVEPARDQARMLSIQPFWRDYLKRKATAGNAHSPALESFRWMIEEFRVSIFAQELKTPEPVSAKRLQNMVKLLDK